MEQNIETRRLLEHTRLRIHFFWCVSILTLALIMVATSRWTELPKFTDYLSTAATISSLVLAIVAIIYSFFSNSQQSQVLGSITTSSQDVSKALTKIDGVAESMSQIVQRAGSREEKLDQLVVRLSDEIAQVRSSSDILREATGRIEAGVAIIPGHIDELKERISKNTAPATEAPAAKVGEKPAEPPFEASLANGSSPLGLFGLLAASYAFRKGLPFDPRLISQLILREGDDYVYGYLQALSQLGFLSLKPREKTMATFDVVAVPEGLEQVSEKGLLAFLANLKDGSWKTKWTAALSALKEHFDVNAPQQSAEEAS